MTIKDMRQMNAEQLLRYLSHNTGAKACLQGESVEGEIQTCSVSGNTLTIVAMFSKLVDYGGDFSVIFYEKSTGCLICDASRFNKKSAGLGYAYKTQITLADSVQAIEQAEEQ